MTHILMMLTLFAVVVLGFWAISQWLRRRGHGSTLDKLERNINRLKGGLLRGVAKGKRHQK